MSYRREQNRKARRGKTPAEIRAGLEQHQARYQAAAEAAERLRLEQQIELRQGLISPAGYLQAIELFVTNYTGPPDPESEWNWLNGR
jgi:hypothetical protein